MPSEAVKPENEYEPITILTYLCNQKRMQNLEIKPDTEIDPPPYGSGREIKPTDRRVGIFPITQQLPSTVTHLRANQTPIMTDSTLPGEVATDIGYSRELPWRQRYAGNKARYRPGPTGIVRSVGVVQAKLSTPGEIIRYRK